MPVWRPWEDYLVARRAFIEKTAMYLYKKGQDGAVDFITDHCCAKASQALDIA